MGVKSYVGGHGCDSYSKRKKRERAERKAREAEAAKNAAENPPPPPEPPQPKRPRGRPPKYPKAPSPEPPPSFTAPPIPEESPTEPQAPPPIIPPVPAPHERLSHWSYPTPLEQPLGPILDPRVITINGVPFQERSDCNYKVDYYKTVELLLRWERRTPAERIQEPHLHEFNLYRTLVQQDLFFFVYFVMKNPLANHPFVVQACREIETETRDTLQVWARDHLKTTIISVARTCQKVFNDPEKRIGIFSATRPLAVKIQNLIKSLFEDPFLLRCFPDILWNDPYKEAPRWSESPEGGLVVRRKGFYKEPTISSWGLIEGMPTGDHYTDMVFDDIVTQDLQTPEIMEKVCANFDMADNIGTRDCQKTVVGTYYRHDDPLVFIRNKRDVETDTPLFTVIRKPATVDGTFAGKSVFLPERNLQKKRSSNIYFYYCQQLLDPTPRGRETLNRDHLRLIKKRELPDNLYRFMIIDGAGDRARRRDRPADAWAMAVIGVQPYRDNLGLSNIYILDLMIEPLDLVQAQTQAVEMYCRNGRILKLGIEKVGMSSTETHITAALRARNRHVNADIGNLEILKPGGRSKELRIESSLGWPLRNGKVHILESIPAAYRDRLGMEMEKFPAWHDDGLDAISYVYDVIKDYRFGSLQAANESQKSGSRWDRAFDRERQKRSTGNNQYMRA